MREILDIPVGDLMWTSVVTVKTPGVSSVAAIMSTAVVTLYPVEPALKAMALMVDYRIRTIPIVTDTVAGRTLVGIVTRRDLTPALKP